MSDITLELVAVPGTDVAFETVDTPGDDIAFEVLPGGSGGGGGVQLDEPNTWEALQTFYSQLPHTPLADVSTTEPTVMLVANDEHGELASFWGSAIDFAGTIIVSSGIRVAERDAAGVPTGRYAYSVYNSFTGTWADLIAEGPLLSDIISGGTPLERGVGTPTQNTSATTKGYVDGLIDSLSATVAGKATIAALTSEATARANADSALGARIDDAEDTSANLSAVDGMIAQAAITTPPTRWLAVGADVGGFFYTSDFQIPAATESLVIEAWSRTVSSGTDAGDVFQELASESMDGLGDWDRYEVADLSNDTSTQGYAEGTASGDSLEWQRLAPQIDGGARSPALAGVWLERRWVYDFTAHTVTTQYRNDVVWDEVDPDDGRKWATIATYTNPRIDSLIATGGHDSWIGRGPGEFHVARRRIWVDGTEVSDVDPSGTEIGDTSVADAVASTTWLADGGEVDGSTPAGGVSLGETSTTAYRGDRGKTAYDHSQATGNPHGTTAADVGAAEVATEVWVGPAELTGAFGSLSSSDGSASRPAAWLIPDATTSLLGTDLRAHVPTEWAAMDVYLRAYQPSNVSPTGKVFEAHLEYGSVGPGDTVPTTGNWLNSDLLLHTPGAQNVVTEHLLSIGIPAVQGAYQQPIRLSFGRNSPTDTFDAGTLGILGLRLVRNDGSADPTAVTAAAGFRAKVAAGAADVDLAVIGDSTSDATTEWVYRLGQRLAARHRTHSVRYRLWNTTTHAWGSWTTVQTGTGARTISIHNMSMSGWSEVNWATELPAAAVGVTPDLAFVSLGHNSTTGSSFTTTYGAFVAQVAATWPSAALILIAQNAGTVTPANQNDRRTRIIAVATGGGWGWVDVFTLFGGLTPITSPQTYYSDTVHPGPIGSSRWAGRVFAALDGA